MTKHHPANERIKHDYFRYLREAKGRDVATIEGVAKALARFEAATGHKDFSGSIASKPSRLRPSWRRRTMPAPASG